MKRLATATLLLSALAAGASAGSLPKAVKMVDRMKMYDTTHFVRGVERGGRGGGGSQMAAEARQSTPAPKPATAQVAAPRPVRAD